MAPPLRCCAASYQAIVYGLKAFRVPLVPPFAATPNVPQFSVGALKGVVGPTPLAPATKLCPVPCGIAKQFVHPVPFCPPCTLPTEIVPGADDPSGILLSSPQGLKFTVMFEWAFPMMGESSYHS